MKNKLEDYVFKIKNFLNKDLCKQITKQLINVKWKDHYFSNYGRQYKRSGNKELKDILKSTNGLPEKEYINLGLFNLL